MKNFKLIGIAANFILGKLGPRVKGSTNKIEFRNNDDTDFVEIQAKAPTTDNGLATKKFVQDEIASMAAPDLSAYETIVNVDSKDAQVLSDANDYTDNAKQGLQSQINNIVSNVDPASLDSLTEIVEAFQEADNNLNNAITNLAQAASSGLNQEILDRQTADAQVLSDANDYTDQQVSSIAIPDLTPYETIANVDSKDAQVLSDANEYTDQQVSSISIPDLTPYETIVNVDNKDAQVLIDAKAYADNIATTGGAFFKEDAVIYVAKNGDDTAGNGSKAQPYQTISKAMAEITDASLTKTYTIRLAPGHYDEASDILIKPFVFIKGDEAYGTKVTAPSIKYDPSFEQAADVRLGLINLEIVGLIDLDNTVFTNAVSVARIVFDRIRVQNINFINKSQNNILYMISCYYFSGTFNHNGGTVYDQNTMATSLNIVAQSNNIANTIFYSSGSVYNNITLNCNGTGGGCFYVFHNSRLAGNLIVDGNSNGSYYAASGDGIPRLTNTTLTNGGQIFRLSTSDSLFFDSRSNDWNELMGFTPTLITDSLDFLIGAIKSVNTQLADTYNKSEVDSKDAQVLVDAKAYTDQEVSNISAPDLSAYALTTYVDNQDAATLASAQAYTDNAGALILDEAKDYTDAKILESSNLIKWYNSNQVSTTTAPVAIVFGHNKFVMVSNQRVHYSYDGESWSSVNTVKNINWTDVAYGNGKFVAVALGGTTSDAQKVMVSSDGINWQLSSIFASDWVSITFGNGIFVAVANSFYSSPSSYMATSTDGITWTNRTTPEIFPIDSVTFGNGTFLAVGTYNSGPYAVKSANGINWTVVDLGVEYIVNYARYVNDQFVVMSIFFNNPAIYSSDLLTWNSFTKPFINTRSIMFFRDKYYMAASNFMIYTSENLNDWEETIMPNGFNGAIYDMDSGNGRLVAVNNEFNGPLALYTPENALPLLNAGEILVGTNQGSSIPLAIGANGQVLTADSNEELGVKWADVPTSGGGGGGASVTGMEVIFAHATQFSYTVLSGQLNSFLNFVDSSEIYEGTTQVLAGSRNHIVLPSGGGVYEFEITYRFNPVDQAGFTSSIPTLINLYTQNFTEFFEDSSRPILSLIDFITGEEDKVYRRQFKVSADATHLYIGITRAQNVTYKSINVSLKKISEIGGGDAPDLSAYETIVNVDAKDAQVLVDANAYTDQEIANVSTPDLSAYETIVNVDTKDAAVLQAAKDYTDANSGGGSGVVQALSGAVVSLIGNSTSWQASLGSLVTIQVPIGAKAVVFEVVSDNNANFSSIAVANTTASPAWRKGYLSSNYNLNGGGFTTSTGILELSGYVAANGLINFPKSYKFCIPNPTAGTYQYYLSAAASGAGTFIRIDYFRILASVVM